METPSEFFQASFYAPQFSADKHRQLPADAKNAGGDHFIVEDLLDFPSDEGMLAEGAIDDAAAAAAVAGGASTDSSTATAFDASCNSSFSGGAHDVQFAADLSCRNLADGPFAGEFCVPYEDMAELEWLSNFVEESFSSGEELQKLQLMSGMKTRPEDSSDPHRFQPEPNPDSIPFRPENISVPAKARSKRSRAAPVNWTSRLLVVSPPVSASSSSESDNPSSIGKKTVKAASFKKKEAPPTAAASAAAGAMNNNSEGRKCLHCATDKTPQWRTGPMGPKTLCNACGVRYKSGRLVPEYRPAASPTFMLTKHSNSHRKVLEIRRQKELVRAQHQQQFIHQKMMFDVSNADDYLIHHHIGPHFRQMI
ncbi:unnamed protein product [Cuscuta epithymum]|uniref:GATA transcription factor n=1 Tax=Cuscuta epithymum TaxID=186058 RepID=A0AAV0FL64_9ASTE|nr:unnamed protein product [Cuscuta epithymum]